MSGKLKIAVVTALVLAVAAVMALRQTDTGTRNTETAVQNEGLPQLVDLGADKCVPCKMMAPILDELKEEYQGKLTVTFIDVWKDPAPGREYGIRAIPTQIFLDPEGRELFRHQGFYSKEDILAKWRELGFDLEAGS